MCNCNSSFCAVCCRRVKAYRFDNVPEITGDLQLYTEFYKVGEAYGHWKFTVDDLIDYLPFGYGTVTSVDASISGALSVTGGPITTAGTLAFTWNGSIGQYVRGDGTLATFPTIVTYTAGTGIDITGGVITNTLPSLWQRTSTVLSPLTANDTVKIGTTNTGIQTLLTLENTSADVNRAVRIDLGAGGIIQSYPDAANSFIQFLGGTNGVRFGTISYGSIFYAIDTGSYALLYTNQYSDTRLAVHRGTADTALHVGGEVKIDTINNYAAATQILVNNGNVISYATKADLGIPTVTPSALSKTDDTNVTLTLGGGYATALLQATSLTIGWTGILAYGRGGTGLGTLGTANQILRVNAGETALEYFSPTWTSNTGTVTSVTVNGLSPLFTASVATDTTTPVVSFTAVSQAQHLVYAAPWGMSGVPLFRQLQVDDLQGNGATNGQVITWDGTLNKWYPATPTGGGITNIASGNGMNFSTITSTGTITMGMPSSISLVSTNSTSTTSHTHAFVPGGTSSQVILGNGGFGSYIPGLWQRSGSEIRPLNANDTVRITTTSTGVQTLLTLANTSADVNRAVRIDLGGGIIQSYPDAANSFIQFLGGTNGVRFGTIAGGTFMSLTDNGSYVLLNTSQFVDTRLAVHRGTADEALHVGGKVKIDTISTVSSSTNLLTTNGGVVETRTIASLTGLPSSVWYLQGGTTASTNTSQNIYRTGDVWLNTGSTGAGGYKFRVTGDSYFEAQQYFAYATYQVWRNSANNAWLNGIRYNTSNQLELGQSSFDIYLPGYTSSRSVDTKTLLDKTLFVNSSGVVKSESSEWVRNDGASCWITSTESHLADNTNRRVTFDSSTNIFNTSYTFDYSSGDYKMFFPGSFSKHLVICTLEYTTSGTPTVTATLRKTSTVVETNISTSADGRKVMTIHAIMSGTSSDYPTLYIYNASGGAAITLQKCKITMIPLGETPP